MCEQDRGGRAGRLEHRGDRLLDPGWLRGPTHVGGQQRAGPERLGEDEPVAGPEPALAQDALRLDPAVDREAERQLCPFRAVAANELRTRRLQHLEPATQELVEILLDYGLPARRD